MYPHRPSSLTPALPTQSEADRVNSISHGICSQVRRVLLFIALRSHRAHRSASIPQKRKDPPAHAPARTKEPERAASQSETDAGTQSTSPTDEYGSGRILCETCGEGISIKDDAGGFTVKYWEAHRNSWYVSPPSPPSLLC